MEKVLRRHHTNTIIRMDIANEYGVISLFMGESVGWGNWEIT